MSTIRRPAVSVVIPTFNRSLLLNEAVRSIDQQSTADIELIVVDDGSSHPIEPPATQRVASRLVRHHRNMGPGAARNTGLAHARGEFLLFLDDDDWLETHRIEEGLAQIGEARMHATAATRTPRVYSGDMRETITHGKLPFTGQVLFRTEDVLQHDPALRVSEDVEWWIRMRDRAVFAWSDQIGIHVRSHQGERSGVSPEVRYRCRTQVLRRHYDSLDRASKVVQLNRCATSALAAQHRVQAAKHAGHAWIASPNALAAKILFWAAMPFRRFREVEGQVERSDTATC